MTNTIAPIQPTSDLAHVLREADLDPSVLNRPRGFRVNPVLADLSEEIAAAVERQADAFALWREGRREIIEVAQALTSARREYESQIAAAVAGGEPEPEPVEAHEILAKIRHDASRLRGLALAVERAARDLRQVLGHADDVRDAAVQRAQGFAYEAVQHYAAMQQALTRAGALQHAAEYLDNAIFSTENGLAWREWNGVEPEPMGVDQAQRIAGEQVDA